MKNRRWLGLAVASALIVTANAKIVAQQKEERRVIRVERHGDGGPEVGLFKPSTVVKTHVFKRKGGGQGQKERTWLGVNIGRVSEVTAAQLGLDRGTGLVVEHVVKNSPAEKAGVKRFDILTAIEDQILVNPDQLQVLVASKEDGEQAAVTLLRGGKRRSVDVSLEKHVSESLHLDTEDIDVSVDGSRGAGIGKWLKDSGHSEGVLDELIWRGKVRGDVGPLHSRTIQIGNAVTVLKDDSGTYHLRDEDGKKHLRFEDEDGIIVFEGLFDEDSSKSLPEGVIQKLKSLRVPEEIGVKHLRRVFQGKHLDDVKEGNIRIEVDVDSEDSINVPIEVDVPLKVDRSL